MTVSLSRAPRSIRRTAISTAVVVSLFGSATTAVAADAPAGAINTRISRIVLGIGSDATEANLAWQSKTSETQFLEYWPTADPANITRVESPRGPYNSAVFYPHEATMTGLEPDTEYAYRVGSDRRGYSEQRTFTTGTDGDSWSFLAMADAQIGVDTKIAEQSAAWNKAVNTATGEHPDSAFIMHLGDQVEGWGAPVKQLEEFTAPEKLQEYRLAVLKGNHETYTLDRHFQDTYFLPNEVDDTANYFFNYNNVLFIGLDGNRASKADIDVHAKFVNETIAAHGADADWVIVGIHHAPFSQGTHYTDKDVIELRNSLTPKLSEAGVDLVLSGHDHIYTRTHLMNGVAPVIPAGASKSGDILIPEDNEVLYVTSTTATGGKYYDFQDENGTTHPNVREENVTDLAHKSTARWRQDYNPDYTSIDVSPESLKLTTYNINTPYVVDQVTLLKKDATQEEPPQEEAPTTTEKPSATTTSAAKPTTLTSVSTVTLTETSTITSPSPTVVETTKVVPTTVKQTVTPTTEKSGADTGNTPSENDANNGSHETTETDASGSSTTGIVLTVLGILFGLIAAIVAVLVNLNPQFVQDIRHKYGI
ncbi:purple acid phosphatase family protein [Corynebacterium coyleae]|uniref:purple acid phosphatase family protein n=1 Tax=Corynebacterium coyleae TaxID=53374 RepID=UPI002551652F|nr:metallophosphoesterase family protein [Corynebacterium coyleae]MDK8663319.1 metallophosphoesterase family protein [Corynebacterium coyleae]MDK8706335.1 metallophosphoesterase family protein [Corynebacterium coyleae]MDK8733274.1 metallophosphoesterase family protein [Corynebacterium coyleae]MDK8892377.1 metallophosphoesterase family protein [Corynebacterium coyleae]